MVISSLEENQRSLEFPVLMKSVNSELVVLFLNETKGVVVGKSKDWSVGEIETDFINCYHLHQWEVFKGKITLKNE